MSTDKQIEKNCITGNEIISQAQLSNYIPERLCSLGVVTIFS